MLSKLCSIGKLKVKIVRWRMFEALLNFIFLKVQCLGSIKQCLK